MIIDRKYTGLPEGVPLNPLQELIVPHMEDDDNLLVIGKTSSGKSTTVPMLGTKALEANKRILYVGSFKALVEEKYFDWNEEGHPWADIPKSAVSGDYSYDEAKLEEIQKAQIITITPESLLSVVRNRASDKAQFLPDVGVVFADELHLVAEEGRGASFEVCLMELFAAFPNVRFVGMSGTIPNFLQIRKWMSNCNGRNTNLVESDYRPVQLEHIFEPYDGGRPQDTEERRMDMILKIVSEAENRDKQFLVCVWKKAFGNTILKEMKAHGIKAEFHNADIKDRNKKASLEKTFKSGSIRVLIATSTLFTGVNLPARCVILTSMEAAGQDIPAYTLQQAAGRAGRPRYDTEGTVYYLTPRAKYEYHKQRALLGEDIMSQLTNVDTLATYFVGAIYMGRIQTLQDFEVWYRRTLASVQTNMDDKAMLALLDGLVEDMRKRGMLKLEGQVLALTQQGKICAQLLLDPYHLYDLILGVGRYLSLASPTDVDLAKVLGSVKPYEAKYLTKWETAYIPGPIVNVKAKVDTKYIKHVAAAYCRITEKDVPLPFVSQSYQLYEDAGRYGLGLSRVCAESSKWTESTYRGGREVEVPATDRVKQMFLRLEKSCSWERARTFLVSGSLSKTERNQLVKHGLSTLEDLKSNPDIAKQVLKPSRLKELGLG